MDLTNLRLYWGGLPHQFTHRGLSGSPHAREGLIRELSFSQLQMSTVWRYHTNTPPSMVFRLEPEQIKTEVETVIRAFRRPISIFLSLRVLGSSDGRSRFTWPKPSQAQYSAPGYNDSKQYEILFITA